MTACPDCSGAGHFLSARKVSGEHFDCDTVEITCETCDGLGEVEHVCPSNRRCDECGSIPLHILHAMIRDSIEPTKLGDEHFGVAA